MGDVPHQFDDKPMSELLCKVSIMRDLVRKIADKVHKFLTFFYRPYKASLCACLFFCSSFAQAEIIRPHWNIEVLELENYVSSLVYLRDLLTLDGNEEENKDVNFIFLSGSNYVNKNGLNVQLITHVLRLSNPHSLNEYSNFKDRCLILNVNINDSGEAILAINGTNEEISLQDYKCAAFALLKFEGIEISFKDTSSVKEITSKIIKKYLEFIENE